MRKQLEEKSKFSTYETVTIHTYETVTINGVLGQRNRNHRIDAKMAKRSM
jgi:hypothetical protein